MRLSKSASLKENEPDETKAQSSFTHALAISPSGSIDEYSDSINDLENRLKEVKHNLDALLEE